MVPGLELGTNFPTDFRYTPSIGLGLLGVYVMF